MQELAYRYATEEMRKIWTENKKFSVWRELWVALAEAQWKCGLDRILPAQIESLRRQINSHYEDPLQIRMLSDLEKECKHDVVAHIRLLSELCPEAKDIIHLGATSCDITDNTDLILMRDGLGLIKTRLARVIDSLGNVATIFKDVPCLAYTHYQPAQLTTVGKRICLWLTDLVTDYEELEWRMSRLHFRGMKGATGTQDSYLKLFGDQRKVWEMELYVAEKFGFDDIYHVTGQTYSRKIDSQILNSLSNIGQTCHKFATDVRLLQHDHEIEESFGEKQTGSSAMPQKRNPCLCERLCSLSRYLVNEAHNAEQTFMNQWLERTLDDSAGRRVYLPSCFLAADAVLRLALNIANGLTVNREAIDNHVKREFPFMLMEPLIIEAVKMGRDRQKVYSYLRDECQKAKLVTNCGRPNNLWVSLDKEYSDVLAKLDKNPENYVGLALQQVNEFIAEVVNPIRENDQDSDEDIPF